MKIFNYEITNRSKDYSSYDWWYILPSIEVKRKYWYLYYITFSWLKYFVYIEVMNLNGIVDSGIDE